MTRWYVLELNPEPWAIGPLGVGRRNGRPFPYVGPNKQLVAFKEAIREELRGDAKLLSGPVKLQIFLWRRIEVYETRGGRTAHSHQADATNMQKAIEDAIQDVLIENDRNVRDVRTVIMEQSGTASPMVVLAVSKFDPAEAVIPNDVWALITATAPDPGSPLPWEKPDSDPLADLKQIAQREMHAWEEPF